MVRLKPDPTYISDPCGTDLQVGQHRHLNLPGRAGVRPVL